MSLDRLVPPLGGYLKAHHLGRAGLVVAGIAAAVVFFIVGAGLRLLMGPVSLGPFAGTLQAAIDQALPGIIVKYDQAAIEWSREEGRVSLVVLGARVFDADGRIIAQAPKADIDLAAGPFLRGRVEVRHIVLVGVQLTLVRTRSGGLRLGVEKDTGESDFLDSLTDTLTATNSSSSTLQRFAVRDARMAFYDEVTGLFVVAPRADVKIETAGPNLDAEMRADIEISGHPAHVAIGLTLPPDKGPVKGSLTVNGLDVGALGVNTKTFDALRPFALNSDLSASFKIDHGAHLSNVEFGADASGLVRLPALMKSTIRVRTMHVRGRYDGEANQVVINDGYLISSNVAAHFGGSVNFVYDANNELARVAWNMSVDKIGLNDPAFERPLALVQVGFRGSYDLSEDALNLDRLTVAGGPFSAEASGKISLVNGKTPAIAVSGRIGALPVREILHYWPLTVGEGARSWVDENLLGGTIGPIAFSTNLPAGILDEPTLPDSAINMTIPLSGGEANYFQGLTHLTAVNGVGTLTGSSFHADFTSARIGPLSVTNIKAAIADLNVHGAPADISAHVAGSVPDVLELIDQKPLGYPTRFGIKPSDTGGAANIDLKFRVPTLKDLKVDDIGIDVNAQVTGFDVALGPRLRLTNGTVAFAVDNAKLAANGVVTLGASPMEVVWTEAFRSTGPITTRVHAKGTLDEEGREALGLNLGGYFKGPMIVDASLIGRRGELTQADMTLDLTPTTLAADIVGINKPPGTRENAHVLAKFGPGAEIRQTDAKLSGPAGTLTADAAFSDDGKLASLDIPAVRFGANNDFALDFTRAQSGVDLSIRGRSLDGSHIAQRGSSTARKRGASTSLVDESFDEPFHVAVKLDRLVLRDGEAIAPFSLDLTGIGNRPASMSLAGSLPHNGTITGTIAEQQGARHLTISTNSAGRLARGLFGLSSMHGGNLDLSVVLPGKPSDPPRQTQAPDYQGTLTVHDFSLTNQPFLARLFTAASLVGFVDLLSGQGLGITRTEVPFSSKNGVISIHDAYATGPTLGVTADGYIDRPEDAIALKGSLVPVLGVDFNRVLSAIPVVGDILTSKKGEGIFGVTYSVEGDADEPEVSVNPLSMLTPGILRRVFQGRMPTAAQAPSNNVSPISVSPAATAVHPTTMADPPRK